MTLFTDLFHWFRARRAGLVEHFGRAAFASNRHGGAQFVKGIGLRPLAHRCDKTLSSSVAGAVKTNEIPRGPCRYSQKLPQTQEDS
jgi:hypothetical protein